MSEKFAYRLVKADRKSKWSQQVDVDKAELELTGLGLEGWELISSFKQSNSSGMHEVIFVLKRRLPSTVEDQMDQTGPA